MAKVYGAIGYGVPVEIKPGSWTTQITEHNHSGDVIKNTSRWSSSSDSTNDDLNINNQISIVANEFAYQNFHSMKYVEFMGTKWKITNVDVQPPRLILTLGGIYNG